MFSARFDRVGVGSHHFCTASGWLFANISRSRGRDAEPTTALSSDAPRTQSAGSKYRSQDFCTASASDLPDGVGFHDFCNRHLRGGGDGGGVRKGIAETASAPPTYPRCPLVDSTMPPSASDPTTFAPRRVGSNDLSVAAAAATGTALLPYGRPGPPRPVRDVPQSIRRCRRRRRVGRRRVPGLLHRVGLTASGPRGFASIVSGARRALTAP